MEKDIQEESVNNTEPTEEVKDQSNADPENDASGQESEAEATMKVNTEEPSDENSSEDTSVDELEKIKAELEESKDKYLRLYSEFENFRRRTAKERLDLIKTANEDLMLSLIPVVDDFERAQKSVEKNEENQAVVEGMELVYNKFINILQQKGLKPADDEVGTEFNDEFHEAIAQIPAPKKNLKGKIVDIIEKGYTLNEKVIRFAKVVIGS